MTANFASARRRLAAKRSSGTASKSRSGWYSAISSPRASQRARTSAGVSGEAIRSGSKSSTASKPAAAAAASFSSSVPLRQTVAIDRRTTAALRRLAGLGDELVHVVEHAVTVRLRAREQLERSRRLQGDHGATVEGAAAALARVGEQLR